MLNNSTIDRALRYVASAAAFHDRAVKRNIQRIDMCLQQCMTENYKAVV